MNRRIPQICLYTPAQHRRGHRCAALGARLDRVADRPAPRQVRADHGRFGRHRRPARAAAGDRRRQGDDHGAPRRPAARRCAPRSCASSRKSATTRRRNACRCSPTSTSADETALQRALEATLRAFGRIDYLVNNAGIAGAEQMVVDLDPDTWRATLQARTSTSNYSLIEKVVPLMKAQGGGYILNVSSYFGGEKHIAVPYPNRADYAVSKAGQRALVENLARFVGPEIQINAIAPGPVDGQRLQGARTASRVLFDRRAQLIVETRRLNARARSGAEGARRGVTHWTRCCALSQRTTSVASRIRARRPSRCARSRRRSPTRCGTGPSRTIPRCAS
jgi:NAD(P)-dependent dehydrogenase (short-subunit alcohol dehydrogenase family)